MKILEISGNTVYSVWHSTEFSGEMMHAIEELASFHSDEIDGDELGVIDIDWARIFTSWHYVFLVHRQQQLIGYAMVMCGFDTHRRGKKIGFMSGIFIHPEHREGLIGYKLIKHIRDFALGEADLSYIEFDVRPKRDFSKLLQRLGASYRSAHYVFKRD